MAFENYSTIMSGISGALGRGEIDAATAADLRKQAAQQEYGAKSFDIGEFEGLLSRLTSAKQQQERGKQVEQRRNIMSTGLANMMSNF